VFFIQNSVLNGGVNWGGQALPEERSDIQQKKNATTDYSLLQAYFLMIETDPN